MNNCSILIYLAISASSVFADSLTQAKEYYDEKYLSEKSKFDIKVERYRATLIEAYDRAISSATKEGNLESALLYKEEKDDLLFSWENSKSNGPEIEKKEPKLLGSVDVTKMTPLVKKAGFSTVMINKDHKGNQPVIDGKVCKTFIWAHAPSLLKYDIPKNANKFMATGGSFIYKNLSFIVKVDGEILGTYNLNGSDSGVVEIDVDLHSRAKIIELVVDSNGDSNGDSSYWAYPEFARVKN
jgi:hypothetical protein